VANPIGLEALRDAHAPDAISVWQVAFGWYLLLFILIFLCIISFIFWKSNYIFWKQKKIALNILKKYKLAYKNDNNSQIASASINELLKKLAIVLFSRDKIAGLKGEAWLEFLNASFGRSTRRNKAKLSEENLNFLSFKKEFLEYPYQTPQQNVDLELFFKIAEAWIKNQKKIILKRKDNHV
jgi:hypothetical protein